MPRIPKISDEQLIELIEQGMNNAEIARQLDVPQPNINTRCKQLRMRHEPLPTPEAAPEEEKVEEIAAEKVEALTYGEVLQGDMLELAERRYEVIGKNSMGLVLRSTDGKTKGITAEAFTAAGFKRVQPDVESNPEAAAEPDPGPKEENGVFRLDKLILHKAQEEIQDFENDKAAILAAVREGKMVSLNTAGRYNDTIAKYLGVRK